MKGGSDMEDKYFGFIYETTNLINGKKYIGKCIFGRQNGWKNYLGSGLYLKRAIEKYGRENFKREIIFLALDEEELNELEELVIDICNAVESDDYYNLKKTAIGGDIFTYNPRKEEIREMRKQQFTGKGNYWYGKDKPEHILQSIKEANSKKVCVHGVIYNSLTECAKSLGIKISTLSFRLNSEYQPDYLYVDKNGKPIPKKQKKKNNNRNKKVEVNGVIYESRKAVAEALGISTRTVWKRIKEGIYKNVE